MNLPYLTRKGLSQATSEVVARWRAARIHERAANASMLDATCGLGADSIALAGHKSFVVSADLDREHVLFARANLEANKLPAHVMMADARAPAARTDLCLIDPDRRTHGRRELNPAAWSPNLARAMQVAAGVGGACLKLAPGLSPQDLLDAEEANLPRGLARRREWLSRRGELVEVCLWTGLLAEGDSPARVATRIDGQGGEVSFAGSPAACPPLTSQEAAQIAWVADPDPALLRAGLLGNLAQELGMAPLAAQIAYLGGQEQPRSPFLRSWRVLANCALDRKKVRSMLAEHEIGPILVRKRGHPESPELLERKFKGRGQRRGHLLIARLERGHRAYLVEPAGQGAGGLVGDEGFEPPTSSL